MTPPNYLSVLLGLFLCCSVSGQPVSNPKAIPLEDTPLTFIQSGYRCGKGFLGIFRPLKLDEKKTWVRAWSKQFNAAEYSAENLDTKFGINNIREFQQAMKEVSTEDGKNFYGILDISRPPGFFWDADIAAQDQQHNGEYRARSLKSNGSLWIRKPPEPQETEGHFAVLGTNFDLANSNARAEFMQNLSRVFNANGPKDISVGPMFGFFMFSEAKLTPLYNIYKDNDLVPLNNGKFPRLRGGNPTKLYGDTNIDNSFFIPPKRAVPLFSENAKDEFVKFAQTKGVNVSKLPADRNEFNDDDSTVQLPSWVEFVPASNKVIWDLWEDWVYEMWTGFCIETARVLNEAQRGNSDYRGVLYFQLPMWYSIREEAKKPITYQYFDQSGALQTRTEKLIDFKEYDWLNATVMGLDLERLMADTNIVGFIHETTRSVPSMGYSWPASATNKIDSNRFAEYHERRIYHHFAQGELCKKVCHDNGKYFGWFIRNAWFHGVAHADKYTLDTAEMRGGMERELPLMKPDIVSALSTVRFYGPDGIDMDSAYHYLLPKHILEGYIRDTWLKNITKYENEYVPPVWLSPFSVGFIDTFNDSIVTGWAHDPWSDSTELKLILTSGPAGCNVTYPKVIKTITVDGPTGPTRAGTIRSYMQNSINYNSQSSTYEFNLNLLEILRKELPSSCENGIYNITIRVTDKQGNRGVNLKETTHGENIPVTFINPLLSTSNVNVQGNFTLFPNPSTGTLTLISSSGISEIEVLDVYGKVVMQENANSNFQYTIDLNRVSKGLYFIKMENTNKTHLEKFILK